MSCKDRKTTECPSTKIAFCEQVVLMCCPPMCAVCKGDSDRIKLRVERARERLRSGVDITAFRDLNPEYRRQDPLPRQLAEEILQYCGKECGGPPGKDCSVTPCAIRGGRVPACPLGLWTISGDKMITKETV